MNTKSFKQTRTLALLGIMTGIIVFLSAVPGLGFIPVGPIQATILHVPVVIVAIVEGPIVGGILGLVFGIVSLLNALLRPQPFSFLFLNPIVAILPRILIGVLTGLLFNALRKTSLNKLAITISAGIGSLVNTIGVLGLIYIIYAQRYMQLMVERGRAAASDSAAKFIGSIALTSGGAEMLVCAILATPICYALLKMKKRGK